MPGKNHTHWACGGEQRRQDLWPCDAYILQNAQKVYVSLLSFLQSGHDSCNYDLFITPNPSMMGKQNGSLYKEWKFLTSSPPIPVLVSNH